MKIVNLGNSMYTNYLIETKAGCLLIDAGNNTTLEKFEKKLTQSGHKLADIKYVFLTHTHSDHLSYLADLLEKTDLLVLAHSNAKERLKMGVNHKSLFTSKMSRSMGKISKIFHIMKQTWKPVSIEERLIAVDKQPKFLRENGFPFDILTFGGHTIDSIGLLSDDKVMFAGDVLMDLFPSKNCIALVLENLEDYIAAWQKIIDHNPSKIYLGHGNPITIEKVIENQKFAKEISPVE